MRLDYDQVVAALRLDHDPWTARPLSEQHLPGRLQRRLGYKRAPGELTWQEAESRARQQRHGRTDSTPYPPKVDLRDLGGLNFVTPVRDQGECRACVAFAVLATLETTMQVKAGRPDPDLDFSEAHLFHCSAGCMKCAFGWQIPLAVERLKTEGVVDDSCLRYEPAGGCGKLCDDWAGCLTRIRGAEHIIDDPAEAKKWLATAGALIGTMEVHEDFYFYASGGYKYEIGARAGSHAVCCIGYDDDMRHWICKNSWGPTWGTGGFFSIRYGECGFGAEMWKLLT